MMAPTHYNSLIKAHPAVPAALRSINIHTRSYVKPNLYLHIHKKGNTQNALLAVQYKSPITATSTLLIYTP